MWRRKKAAMDFDETGENMASTAPQSNWHSRTNIIGDGTRYTQVAIWLHWAIALLIIWNLVSGLLIWDLAEAFFKENRFLYFMGLTSHLSAGMTVLTLTVARIAWRLLHEPPAYPVNMKAWERHASHFVHFLLYAGMLLMPLTGWAILSAHPPAGTPGAEVARSAMVAASPAAAGLGASGLGHGPAGPPPGALPPPPGIWWVIPMPTITPISNIGIEPGGVKPQHILHDEFAEWHEVGGYIMILLLLLHIAGALKHQLLDKEPTLQRMGLGGRKANTP
jgi:cytochrome b561